MQRLLTTCGSEADKLVLRFNASKLASVVYAGNFGPEQLCPHEQGKSLPMTDERRYLSVVLSSLSTDLKGAAEHVHSMKE